MQNKIILKVSVLLAIITLVITLLVNGLEINCLFHKITGLYCPGCGITRCLLSIVSGDFYQAFRYNPYVFLLLPFITVYILYQIYIWVFDKKDNITAKIPKRILIFLIVSLIIYGVLRNISYFSYLAPTKIH